MVIGSLFSGVGGLELGLEMAGLGPVAWQVERDPFCRAVLAMHWPDVRRYDDVRKVGRRNLAPVDVLCGGFPCQDVSSAGKGEGLDGARSGLWKEQYRIACELLPRVVVVENVRALVARGLDRVVRDLEEAGYVVFARIIAASDVGAPHLRERLFVVAHAAGERRHARRGEVKRERHDDDGRDAFRDESDGRDSEVADAHGERLRIEQQRLSGRRARGVRDEGKAEPRNDGAERGGRAQSGLGRVPHGLSDRLDRWPSGPGDAPALWEPPRAVTTYSPTRAARLHALGNAVVPQVAREVGLFVRELLS
jgi:DNA (cytosine-5)-methyltransferase 1